ncbi:titin isoform X10 [Juglans microcarpa x Juglans regia]|uniref:titin isoform X10 n=1 Tax=Juglans microcarpa x Juglans regia TaxID=2249226 RepID=UPI001B7E6A6D|nr:titin isoform X10 [Juglans microcarpa x Juglans regia]
MVLSEDEEQLQEGERFEAGEETGRGVKDKMPRSNDTEEGLLEDDTTKVYSTVHTGEKIVKPSFQVESPEEAASKSSGEDEGNNTTVEEPHLSKQVHDGHGIQAIPREQIAEANVVFVTPKPIEEEMPKNHQDRENETKDSREEDGCLKSIKEGNVNDLSQESIGVGPTQNFEDDKKETTNLSKGETFYEQQTASVRACERIALGTIHNTESLENIPGASLVKRKEGLQGEVENQHSTESSIENRDEVTSSIKITEIGARVTGGEEETDHTLKNDEPGETDREVESPGEVLDTAKQGNGLQGDDDNLVPPETSINKRDELTSSVKTFGDNHENNRLAEATENSAKTTPEDSEPPLQRDETGESIALETAHGVEIPKNIPDLALVKQDEGLQEECEKITPPEAEIEKRHEDTSYNSLSEATENSVKATPEGQEDSEHALHKHETRESIALETNHGVEKPKNIPESALVKQEEVLQGEVENQYSTESSIENRDKETSSIKVAEDNDKNNRPVETTENHARVIQQGEEERDQILPNDEPGETDCEVESPGEVLDTVKQGNGLQGDDEKVVPPENSFNKRDELISSVGMYGDNHENNRLADASENSAKTTPEGEDSEPLLKRDETAESITLETNHEVEVPKYIPDPALVKQEEGLQEECEELASTEAEIEKGDGDISYVKVTEDNYANNKLVEGTENSTKTTPKGEEDPEKSIVLETAHGVEIPKNIPDLALVKQEEGLQAECEKIASPEAEIEKQHEDTSCVKVVEDKDVNNNLAEATENSAKATPEGQEDSEHALHEHETRESIALETYHGVESPKNIPDSALVKQEEVLQGEVENQYSTESSIENRDEEMSSIKVAKDNDENNRPAETTENHARVVQQGDEETDHVLQNDESGETNCEAFQEILDTVKQGNYLQGDDDNLVPETLINKKDELTSSVEVFGDKTENNGQAEATENSAKTTPESEEDSGHALQRDETGESIAHEANHGVEGPRNTPNPALVKQEEGLQAECEKLAPTEAEIEKRQGDISYFKVAEDNNANNKLAEDTERNTKILSESGEDSYKVLLTDEPGQTIRGLTNHNVKSPENNLDSLLAKQGEGMQGESDNLGQTKTSIKVAEDEDNIGPVETTKNSIKVILKGEEDSEHVLQKDDPQQKPIQERNHDVEKPEENLDKSLVNQEEDLQVEGENLAPTEASMENKDEDIPPVKMAGHKAENNMQDEDRENSPKGTPKVEDSEHSLSKDAQEIIGCEADREIEGLEKFDNSPLVNQEVFLQREGENLISKEASVERRDENTSYMKIAKGNNNDDNDGLAAEAADISVKATGKGEENLEEVLQKDEPGKEPEQLLDVVSEDKEAEYILEKMENTTLVKEEGIIQNLEETSEVEKKEETKTVDDKKEKEAAIEKVFNTTSFSEETGVQMAEEIHNVRDRSPEFNEKEITKENSIEEQQCGALETAASSTNTEKSVIEKPATAELPSSSDKKETVKESLKEEESDVTVLKEEAGGTALEFIKQTDLTEKAKAETLQDCAGQSRDFTALTTIENYFIIPEVPVEEINEKLLKQEKNTIIDSDSASEAVVSELGLKETKPDNKEHAKSFDIVPEEKGLATIETGVSLDSVDIEVQSEENSKSEENMSKKILTVADETGEKIEHQMEDKAPTGGIDNELSLTSRETTLDGISEDGSRDSYIMPLQEHEPTTTEVGKIMEETSARDEIAKIPSSVQKTDEKLIQKEDESINPTDVSELLSSDDGKDGAIEELKHEDAELHMPPKRHIEKNSYETEDVEISKRGETSALADQTEVCKLESLEVENPSDDPSKPIAVSPYQGSEKTILEQGDFVQTEGILTGVLVEKGTTGMKTNVCSHECEPTNAKTNELLAEKNLESDDLGQKLVFGTESEAKDPSHETLPQTNKSQTEENSNDVQDWNFESVEPQITPQVQGKTETKMAMETKLKAEDQINVSPTTKETITTHTVTEGVHERIQEVDGSEGIKEQAIHGDIELKETHKVSAEDYAFEKVEDCGTKSTDYLEATDSEQTETVKADIQEATRETETSGTKALKEEKIQDEFSLKPEGVMTAVAKDSEEKIKVEVDHFLEENDNATVVPAESIVGEVPMDDKAVKETSSDERLETITIQPRPQAEEAGSKKLRIEGVDGSESSKEQAIQQESQLKEIYEVSTEEDILEKVEDSGTKSSTYLEETDFSEQTETLTTNIQETTREIEASGTKAPEEENIQDKFSLKLVDVPTTEAEDTEETIKEKIKVEANNILDEDNNVTAVPVESPIHEAHMDDKAIKETSPDESLETVTFQPCLQAEDVGSKKLPIEEVDGIEGIKEQAMHGERGLKEIHRVSAKDDILQKVEDCGTKSSDYLEAIESSEQIATVKANVQEPTMETELSGSKAPKEENIQDEVSLKPANVSTRESEDAEEKIKEYIEVETDNFLDEDDNTTAVPTKSPKREAHKDDKAVKETSSDESVEIITIQPCPQAEEVGSKKLRIEEVDGSEGINEQAIHGESELKEIHKVSAKDDIVEKVDDCGTKSSDYLEEIDSSDQTEIVKAFIQEQPRETEAFGAEAPEEEKIQNEVSLKTVDVSETEAKDTKEAIKEKIKVEADNLFDEDDNATAVSAELPIREAHMDDKADKETSSDESVETITIQPCPQAEEVGSKKLQIEEVDGKEGIKELAIHEESELKEIHKVYAEDDILEKLEDCGRKSSDYLEETDSSEQTETFTADIQEPTRETEASGTKAPEEENIQDEVSLKLIEISTTEAEDKKETIKEEIQVGADNLLDEDGNATAVPAESPIPEAHMDDKAVKETSSDESVETITIQPCPQAEEVGSKKLQIEEVDGSEGIKKDAIHGESELKEIHKVYAEDDILEKVEDCGTKSSYYLEEIDSSEQIETLTADIQEPTRETEASGTKGPEEEEIQDEVSLKPVEISTTEAEDTKEMIKEKIKVETDNFLDEDDNATAVPAESPIPEVHMDDKAIKETRSDESIETIRIQPCPQAEEVGSKKLRIEEVDGSEGIKEKAIHGESESKEIHKVSTKDDIVEKVEDSGTKSSTYLEETDFSEQTETLTANIQETTRETEASGTKAEEKIQDEVSLKPVDVSTTEAEDTEETIKGKIKVEADNILDEDDNAIAVPAESPVREAHMGDKVDKETSLGESLETVTIHPCPQAEDVGSKKLPIEEVDGSEGIKEQDMHGEQELKEIHRVSAEDDILQKVEDCGTKSSDYQEETDSSEQTETLTADIQEPTRETEASRKKAPEEEKIQDEVSLKPVEISTTEAEDTKEMIKEKIKVETDNFLDEDDNATAVPAESPIPEVHMDDKAIKETRSDESIETIRIQPCPQAEEVGSKKLRIEEVDGSEGIKEKAIHGESESKEIHKVSTKDDIVEKVEDSGTKSSTYLEETDFSEQTETLTANIQETTRETEASGTKAEEKIQDEVSLKPVDVSTTEAEDTEETIKGKIKVEADNILDEDDNAIAVPAESPVREAHMGDKVDKETSLGESLETVTIHPCPQAEDVGSKKLPIEEVDGSEGIKEQDMHGEQELKEIHRVSAEDDILQKVEDCGTKSSDYQEETDSNEQTETLITDIQEPTRETEASRKKAPEEEKIQDEVSLKPVEISTTEAEDTKETIKEKIKVEADNFLDEDDNATAVLAESPIPEAHMDDKAIKETRSDESVETITIQPCPHAEEVGSKKLRLEEVDGSEGTKEKAIYGESELKEIHKVYAKHDIVEKVDDCGTKSSDYLEETDSSDQTETVQAFIQEQPRETEALGAKAPEEENIQDEVSLKLVDVLTTEAKDTEETIKEKIKVEADNILDEDDNATAVPAESPISEAYMNDKAVKETCPDESLETVTIQPCPQVEDVGSKKLPIEEVDGSEGIKGLAMHGERELKEIHRVSAEDDILQKVEDCGTKSFNYLEATDPSEQTATVKANIQEQTMETELSGTKALEEENIQDEVSLKPANVLTIEAKDAEEKIKEYTAVEADKFLDENDNATAVPAESCIGEAHMDVEAIKEISSDESLEIITIENIRLEQEEPMVHKNEEKESVIPVKPGADEVEDVKKSPNTVVSSKYLGVEETQETGQSLRVEKLDSDRTEEGIKEDSGTMSEAKSLGIEMVTQGEMTYGQTLPTGNLEEEFQTPSSALLSLEREHGPTTVVKEAEATKIMEEEIIDDKNIDDSLATKATEEACLQNKEQLQTLSSALLSKEQEHEAQTAFKKTEEESTKEVETLDDKNINNFSAIKESEETGLEQEEPMDHEHVEKESATLEKQDTDDVEVTKTVSAADSRPKYFGGEETYEIGESFRVEKLDSEGNEEGVKESSVTVFKSESLGIETVTKDEMTPDQTLPAVNLEEHFQIESSELHSLGQEHGPTTAVMDTEAIKTTEAKMLDDETCLQKEEQLQTLSSTLLSGVQEHIAKAAFKKTEEDSIKEMEMLGDKNINNLAIKATENTNLEQEVHRELKVSTLGLEINKEVQKGSLNKSLEEEYCTLDGFSKLETEENEERTYPHIVSETRELTKPIEEASNIRFEISEKSIESALHVHCQEVLLNPEEKIQDEGIVKLEVDNSCDKTENATSNVETTESSSGEAALNDVSTKDTSSVESSLETVKTVSSTLAKEVASMNLEKTSSSFLTQLPNIVDKNSEKASESQKSIDANEVEETKTASGAVFESKYQTDETGERLTVEKLDAAEGKETKGTSETSSNSKALCVEADSKDDVIAGQTLAAGKLGDQLQTIFSSFLSREQEHGTTTAGERTEEEEMKGAKMIGDESIDNSSAAKTTEGTCLKMKEHMELEVSTLGLESSKATHRGSSNEVQEEEGSKLDQASKLEPHEKEEMKYDDSPSVVQSHQVLPKSEDMKEKHLEAAMTDLNAEESQCKETVEENQIFKNRVSMEEVREVMEENEVAKDSQSVSLGDETIIESHQGDELKAVACPEEETNKTFKATTNANQHEALKLPELIDKDSASENIEKKITAEESSYLDEAEGKNIEEAVSELDLDYKSGETHITKEKTEVIALSEKEVVVEISQKEGTAGFSEVNEITEDIQQLEKNSYAASEKKIPVEEEPSENKEAAFITDNEDVLPVLQHPSDKALQKVELEHERPGKATEVDAEERRIECEGEKRMGGSGEINKESASVDSEKMSSSDLMQISMKKSLHAAKNLTKEREPMPSKAEIKNEGAETTQIDKARADEEEGDEHKRSEPDSDAPVMVEASKDTEAKVPHKKSHNILSGVGSKVKHSISKVKKAITGKSSHPKTSSLK